MKFSFIFGFILLILLVIGVIVGLPYAIQALKSGSLSFPFFSMPWPAPQFFQNVEYFPKIKIPALPVARQVPAPTLKPGESLHKGKVSIGGVYFSGAAQINLRTFYFFPGAVDLTGWKIKSAKKGEIIIGKGVNLPQIETIPSDIWIKSGDSLDVIAGLSPLSANFRANSCFSWLEGIYNFGYSLNYCAGGFNYGDLAELDGACQNLILGSGYCRAPDDNILNRQSGKCRIWVEKNMNYNACVSNHRNDRDFYKEWKIYTGSNNPIFDSWHDKIELRDQAGLLVDSYEY